MSSRHRLTTGLVALAIVAGIGAAGCGSNQKDDGPPGSAAQAGGTAAANPFGKTSNETQLPPQGKPPAAGEDVNARARAAASAGGTPRPR